MQCTGEERREGRVTRGGHTESPKNTQCLTHVPVTWSPSSHISGGVGHPCCSLPWSHGSPPARGRAGHMRATWQAADRRGFREAAGADPCMPGERKRDRGPLKGSGSTSCGTGTTVWGGYGGGRCGGRARARGAGLRLQTPQGPTCAV